MSARRTSYGWHPTKTRCLRSHHDAEEISSVDAQTNELFQGLRSVKPLDQQLVEAEKWLGRQTQSLESTQKEVEEAEQKKRFEGQKIQDRVTYAESSALVERLSSNTYSETANTAYRSEHRTNI